MLVKLTFGDSRGYTTLRAKSENLSKVLVQTDADIVKDLLRSRMKGIKSIESRVNNIDYYVEVI